MKKIILLSLILIFSANLFPQSAQAPVKDDPLNACIYTLDNGLKVYLTVYKDVPRIQCYIAVRVGSKNDPKETTGLAHYLEHLMFKGTDKIGTTDWENEKSMLAAIEDLFEVYRFETDPAKRAAIYHKIDSISYEASKLAIPNEYSKIMKFIGSQGTNAWTSNDNTVYIENIPSNQLENWAKVQSERFLNPVIRLFHTELETVYEEKNMSLTNDGRKVNETILSVLFPNHPYGQQTTLGEAEHLKNPSIKNIKNFYSKYYVPNNMAICLSGDFDPKEAIKIIDKYFGKLEMKPVKRLKPVPDEAMPQPVTREITGLESEFVRVAFRIGGPANSEEIYLLNMADLILSNGKSGLIDLNINQKQLTSGASGSPYVLCDNSAYILSGKPKQGQSLEEVATLLLEQIGKLKSGDFDESLIAAAINNLRLREMKQTESNSSRAMWMANSFMNDIPWETACHSIDKYGKITKQDIIDFANRHFKNNYVVVYKRQGTPEEVEKVVKPAITPIVMNRDSESLFFREIKNSEVKNIDPVFVDFEKEITKTTYKNIPVYYLKNSENSTFSLRIYFNLGELHDLRLPVAAKYFNYLGTEKMSAEDVKRKFYRLACSLSFNCSDDCSSLTVSGLGDNMEAAFQLATGLLAEPIADTAALQNLIADMIKERNDAKANQNAVFNALRRYCEYGEDLVSYTLSEEQIKALTDNELITIIKGISKYSPEIYYYGPAPLKQVLKTLKKYFSVPKQFAEPQQPKKFVQKEVVENQVFFAPYNAKQAKLVTFSRGDIFNRELYPQLTMYNQYFGGGMNGIVFQEMREKRSLAYTAQSSYVMPSKQEDYMYNYSYIATQNDKVIEAFENFNILFDSMPVSQVSFDLAKEAAKTSIATNRITKSNILYTYRSNLKKGWNYDYRKDFYDKIDSFTLDDVVNFNKKYIKGKPKIYMILSKKKDIDLKAAEEKFGKVTELSLEDIFGY
ncbi:MAG: insulinase family protein [Bacteroidales bacterium]|nr:insulinase family protein [Bacteroidales bacterium]